MKIHERAPRRQVMELLCNLHDVYAKDRNLAGPVREYVAGRLSKDALLDWIAGQAEEGCLQVTRVVKLLDQGHIRASPEVVREVNRATATSMANLSLLLTAVAAMRQDNPRFVHVAEAAIAPARAVVQLLGGPPGLVDLMIERANLEPSAPDTGRNQPCPCGSGKKYKLCHGRRAA